MIVNPNSSFQQITTFLSILPSREKITEFFLKNIFWISGAVVVGICFKKFCYDRLVQTENSIKKIGEEILEIKVILNKVNLIIQNRKPNVDSILTKEQLEIKDKTDEVLKIMNQALESKEDYLMKQTDLLMINEILKPNLQLNGKIEFLRKLQSENSENFKAVLEFYEMKEEEGLHFLEAFLEAPPSNSFYKSFAFSEEHEQIKEEISKGLMQIEGQSLEVERQTLELVVKTVWEPSATLQSTIGSLNNLKVQNPEKFEEVLSFYPWGKTANLSFLRFLLDKVLPYVNSQSVVQK
ncbi:MAG: hypothetical protein L0207_03490 [Chlamydiae bacterium]|nr:hypothetical protein [Chlamydiota bacterium]